MMRFIYAIAGMMVFVFLFSITEAAATIPAEISDNVYFLALAITFAGGMAGGDKS